MTVEDEDAGRVNEAIEAISNGLLETAVVALKEVIRNTPADYKNSSKSGNNLSIKFWTQEDFLNYCTWPDPDGISPAPENVCWIRNAYPRAYFYLGFVAFESNQLSEARE